MMGGIGKPSLWSMPKYIVELAVRAFNDAGKVIKGSKVLIMGLIYDEE
jgi:UDP-N-acetyl-D-mannosaminuronate dehydrogenase